MKFKETIFIVLLLGLLAANTVYAAPTGNGDMRETERDRQNSYGSRARSKNTDWKNSEIINEEALQLVEAKSYYESNDYRKAQDTLLKLLQSQPKSVKAYFNLGLAFMKVGRYKLALKSFNKALELDPKLIQAKMHMASIYLEMGEYNKSVDYLKELLEKDKANPIIPEKLGIIFFNKKLYPKAILYFNRAISLAPAEKAYLNNYLGMAHYANKAEVEAQKALLKAKFYKTLNTEGQRLLSMLLIKNERFKDGSVLLLDLVRRGDGGINDYNNLGAVYVKLEKYKKAEAAFEKVLEKDPEHLPALHNIGQVLIKENKFKDALMYYRRIEALERNNPEVHFQLGFILENLERYEQALTAYLKARALGYKDTTTINNSISYVQSKVKS
jgi:tetratricopeptide (TPR) repeat protein